MPKTSKDFLHIAGQSALKISERMSLKTITSNMEDFYMAVQVSEWYKP